ncbi:MAG TPA: gamma-glutamyl-gamma-aminobutyrate hydrolase family protein [Chloroflexota bacterium]
MAQNQRIGQVGNPKPRPLILIPCGTVTREDGVPVYGASQEYVRAIQQAGGSPVLIPPGDVEAALALLGQAGGLLLTGGADVDPGRYGAQPSSKLGHTDPERDELEIALVRAARERRQAVFGICRGQQLINVAVGGTLYQDVPSEHPSPVMHDTKPRVGPPRLVHSLDVEKNSRLADIMGADNLEVNSFHHQAVKDLGPGLRATAFSPDGLVEAFESDGGRLLAVQCHPEELTHLEWARRLFAAFVEQAGE